MLASQKILLIGANGQVGKALQQSSPSSVEMLAIGRGILDLTDADAIRKCIRNAKPDIIINAAAYTAVDNAESEVDLAFAVNAVAPKVIGEEAELIAARVIHYSTDYVFDGKTSIPYLPNDKKNPLSVYGASKSLGEDNLLGAMSVGKLLVLRTAWVYAPGGKNFVNTMLRLMQSQSKLRVVADQFGTPTAASSIAQATWAALEHDVTGLYHFTDSGVATWYDFACQIERIARQRGIISAPITIEPIATSDYPQAAVRPRFGVLDKSVFWKSVLFLPPHWCDKVASNF